MHLSYLWRGHSHTNVDVVPVHNLFGCVINYWKHKESINIVHSKKYVQK